MRFVDLLLPRSDHLLVPWHVVQLASHITAVMQDCVTAALTLCASCRHHERRRLSLLRLAAELPASRAAGTTRLGSTSCTNTRATHCCCHPWTKRLVVVVVVCGGWWWCVVGVHWRCVNTHHNETARREINTALTSHDRRCPFPLTSKSPHRASRRSSCCAQPSPKRTDRMCVMVQIPVRQRDVDRARLSWTPSESAQ